MPTYVYRCPEGCGDTEVSALEPPSGEWNQCPTCGAELRRVWAVNVNLANLKDARK